MISWIHTYMDTQLNIATNKIVSIKLLLMVRYTSTLHFQKGTGNARCIYHSLESKC